MPYDNSTVEIGKRQIASVSGGTRWGGGLWINSEDLARFGLLILNKGNWRGKQLIAASWIRDATSVRADQPHLRPGTATPFFGYGYQTWIFPGERRMFALLGVRGQSIYIDPASHLVMVTTAVRKLPVDPGVAENGALWRAVTRDLAR